MNRIPCRRTSPGASSLFPRAGPALQTAGFSMLTSRKGESATPYALTASVTPNPDKSNEPG